MAAIVAALLVETSQVKAAPVLTVTITPSANPVGQGQSINYAIKVTNGSSSTVSNVAINDTLSGVSPPSGSTGYTITKSAGSCQSKASGAACTSTSLSAGQSITVTVAGTVSAPAGSMLQNTASASATSGGQTVITSSTNATLVQLPQGFTQSTIITAMHNPSVIAFAPNGDMWVGQQTGAIYIYHNGHLNSSPVVTLPADGRTELGLLGIAFDPNFSSNGYFYVSYTVLPSDYTQLSRLTFNGSTAPLSSEKVLIKGDEVQQHWGFGPGETLKVGPDGKLWWSVGGNPYPWGNAQTLQNVYGKLHRLNLDGSAPADNPFVNVPHALPSIYAYGLRNPFRFTFLPNGGVMVADTGSSYWEELDSIQKGSNYGWPITEGDSFSYGYANPVYSYGHLPNDGAESAILAYHQPSPGQGFPNQYNNVVFFGDYNRKDIEAVTFDPSYQTPTSDFVFSASAGTISDLVEGPDGSIYWTSIYSGSVYKISANQSQFPPTAVASFTPNNGLPAVQFSSNGSSDPYGQSLSYSWNFGDGQTSTSANPTHTYTSNGVFTATLTVSNASQSTKATTTVMVGRTTTASISVPSNYNAGQTVNFSGSALDSVDGNLPASAYTWQVDFISNGVAEPFWLHEVPQPFFGPKGGVTSGSFTIPNDMSQSAGTFYRVTLTVVNSAGVPTVVTQDIHPNTTSWTANTNVAGAPFYVDGVWHNSSYTTQDVVGVKHVLMGQAEQNISGQNYRMQGWYDGSSLGELSKSFTTTSSTATYTAEYDAVGSLPSGWQNADIGGSLPGTGEFSSATNTFYIDGAGADASGSTQQFHYTYQTLNGDGTIVARVRYQTNTNPWAKAGLMVMQSPSSGAAFVDALVTPDVSNSTPNLNGVNCVFTDPGAGCDAPLPAQAPAVGHGVGTQSKSGGPTMNTSIPALAGYSSPNKWLKLVRSGSTFTGYYSTDGSNWHSLGSTSMSMSGPVTIGLFVSSHDNRMLESVGFDNVSINGGGGPPPPPPSCPATWNCADIGSTSPAGTESVNGATWTIQGAGSDIQGTADSFHYDWQTLGGNTMSARLTSQQNTNAWAKAGVMFRANSAANAANYALLYTPANGIVVSYRTTNGGSTTVVHAIPPGTPLPIYLQITRSGTTFSAQTSTDGVTWTAVPNSTVTVSGLSGTILEGLVDTSHANGTLCTVTMDSVVPS